MIQILSAWTDCSERKPSAKAKMFTWTSEHYQSITTRVWSPLPSARNHAPFWTERVILCHQLLFSKLNLCKEKAGRGGRGAEHKALRAHAAEPGCRLLRAAGTSAALSSWRTGNTTARTIYKSLQLLRPLNITKSPSLPSLFTPHPLLYFYLGGCVQAFGDDVSCGNLWVISTISQHVAFLFCSVLPCSGDWN